jgi:hypothetical protein
MMSMDLTNISRWIKASASVTFKANLGSLPLYVEGQERFTNKDGDFCEFRLDGPWLRQVSNNFWVIDIEVNVLVNCVPDPSNIYKIELLIGQVQNAFQDVFYVKKYGSETGDDQTDVGYFQRADRQQAFRVNKFGQLNPKTKLIQASVEARYRMTL